MTTEHQTSPGTEVYHNRRHFYRLLELLGSGSFAEVWLAEEVLDGHLLGPVAVKIFNSDIPLDAILREADHLRRLDHPHVLRFFGAVAWEGRACLAMEQAEQDLAEAMAHKDRPFLWEEALPILLGAAQGLAFLHEKELLHGDIKPANILFIGEKCKLGDFGAVSALNDQDRFRVASPAYASPEALFGYGGLPADVYSLGATAYEMLVGKLPFPGRNWHDTDSLDQGLPPLPDDLTDEASLLLRACMAPEANERWSARRVVDFLASPSVMSITAVLPKSGRSRLGAPASTANREAAARHFRLGQEYASQGHYSLAIEKYTKAMDLDPSFALACNSRGNAHYHLGQHPQALEDYERAIEMNNEYPMAYYNRGLVWMYGLDKPEAAIEDFTKTIELSPDDDAAWFNRGLARMNGLQDYRAAIEDFDQSIALKPDYALAYNNKGIAYRKLGDYRRAIQSYDQAIALDPKDSATFNNRGIAYRNLGDSGRAVKDFDRAIALDAKDPVAYFNRGLAFHDQGKFKEAIQDYGKAALLSPRTAVYYYSRGKAYTSLGEYAKARQDLSRACELGHPKGCQRLKELEESLGS